MGKPKSISNTSTFSDKARPLAFIGKKTLPTCLPAALASAQVQPTLATSGSVK